MSKEEFIAAVQELKGKIGDDNAEAWATTARETLTDLIAYTLVQQLHEYFE